MRDKEKQIYALYFSKTDASTDTYSGERSGSLHVRIVTIQPSGKIINMDSDDPFSDLAFYCQWCESLSAGEPFAWTVRYRDVYTVELRTAERMLKVLKRAERILSGFPVRPVTFGQWLALMAAGFGITTLVEPTTRRGSCYADDEYKTWKGADVQYIVDTRMREIIHPEPVTV